MNDQNFQPRQWPSSVVVSSTTEEGHRRGLKFWSFNYLLHWIKVSFSLLCAIISYPIRGTINIYIYIYMYSPEEESYRIE